jgi:hypothetical protein
MDRPIPQHSREHTCRHAHRFTHMLLALAAIALAWAASAAHAGPPFFTDDPEPVEKGHGEFYISSQSAWSRDGWSGTLPHFEFNYGPIEDVHLHMIAPLAYSRPDDTHTMNYGYGDTELGVKWRPIHEDGLFKGCPQIGTFPLVEIPNGSRSRGLGNGGIQVFLPIWLQKSWGEERRQWTTYGGGGYWINEGSDNHDYVFFGWALQKQITDKLTLGGEVFFGSPSTVGGSTREGFQLGGVYDFTEHHHLLFAVGRDFHGPNLLTFYLGYQLTF